jgi:hypothetical protein
MGRFSEKADDSSEDAEFFWREMAQVEGDVREWVDVHVADR